MSLPFLAKKPLDIPPIVSVELIQIAEKANIPYIILYIFDAKLLKHPDVGVRHLQFIHQSIKALNTALEPYNKTLSVFYGASLDIFKFLTHLILISMFKVFKTPEFKKALNFYKAEIIDNRKYYF